MFFFRCLCQQSIACSRAILVPRFHTSSDGSVIGLKSDWSYPFVFLIHYLEVHTRTESDTPLRRIPATGGCQSEKAARHFKKSSRASSKDPSVRNNQQRQIASESTAEAAGVRNSWQLPGYPRVCLDECVSMRGDGGNGAPIEILSYLLIYANLFGFL